MMDGFAGVPRCQRFHGESWTTPSQQTQHSNSSWILRSGMKVHDIRWLEKRLLLKRLVEEGLDHFLLLLCFFLMEKWKNLPGWWHNIYISFIWIRYERWVVWLTVSLNSGSQEVSSREFAVIASNESKSFIHRSGFGLINHCFYTLDSWCPMNHRK